MEEFSILWICHNVPTRLRWHWWYFPCWAMTNAAATNTGVQPLSTLTLSFLLGKYLGVEWLGHMMGVYFTF